MLFDVLEWKLAVKYQVGASVTAMQRISTAYPLRQLFSYAIVDAVEKK